MNKNLLRIAASTAASCCLIQTAGAATFFWEGGAESDPFVYSNPLNWSPEGPPSSADTAVLENGATMRVDLINRVDQFDFGSGTLSGDGELSVSTINWNGGTLALDPSLGTLRITGTGGSFSGTGFWDSGQIVANDGAEVEAGTTLNLRTSNSKNFDGAGLDINGTLNFQDNFSFGVSEANIVVRSPGVLDIQNDVSIVGMGEVQRITVFGQLTKSGGNEVTQVDIPIDVIAGDVTVSEGELEISQGGSLQLGGTIDTTSGSANLVFNNTGFSVDSSSSISAGTGSTKIGAGGMLNVDGSFSSDGTVDVEGGVLNIGGSASFSAAGLNINNDGRVVGDGFDAQVDNFLSWESGGFSATDPGLPREDPEPNVNGTVTLQSGSFSNISTDISKVLEYTRLDNFGAVNQSGESSGSIKMTESVINNFGDWQFLGTSSLFHEAGGPRDNQFVNQGFVGKFGDPELAGETAIGVLFDNRGTVEVGAGTIYFNGGYIQNHSSGRLSVSGGTARFNDSVDIEAGDLIGDGTIRVDGGELPGVLNMGDGTTIDPGFDVFSPDNVLPTQDIGSGFSNFSFFAGTLNIDASLNLSPEMAVYIDIFGSEMNEYDAIHISGEASLDGQLIVRGDDDLGLILSSESTVIPFLTATSVLGEFGNYSDGDLVAVESLFSNVIIGEFTIHYEIDQVTLTNFTPVPEAETYILMALGLGMIGIFYRRQTKNS